MENAGEFQLDYRTLFEAAPVLAIVLTPDLKIMAVSNAHLQATMMRREDMVGKNVFDVFPDNPNDPRANGSNNLRSSLHRVLATKAADTMPIQKYDVERQESQGGGFEERYWSILNSPILDEKGEVTHIINRVEDVTEFIRVKQQRNEQAKLSETLRFLNERMEGEIYARAQEIDAANKKLRSANDELSALYEKTKELEQQKTHFFANVSHELRTPLTLILGLLAKRMAEDSLLLEERRDLEVAHRNAQLLLKQVNDLLDIAKLEAGKLAIEYSNADVAQLVRLTASNFESLARERSIKFSVRVSDHIAAQIDSPKLQRILLNLLSNAFKFTPVGGAIEVTAQASEREIYLSVSDSGPGVPPSMREAVFERFRQLDGEGHRVAGGTGLGLAIVRELAALHHGRIQVQDSALGGAKFEILIPNRAPEGTLLIANKLNDRQTESLFLNDLRNRVSGIRQTGPRPVQRGALVLVVEDNPDMRVFVTDILAQKYRVETAQNGKEGLEKALRQLPDVIVSDVMMPEMTGDEMANNLFAHPETQDIPLLMLSAKSDDEFRMNQLRKGVRDYIAKPFSAEELQVRVDQLIAQRKKTLAERERLIHQLEKSNQDLERFAYAAAHDLKTPLRSIVNLSQWIEEDSAQSLPKESQNHLEELRRQVSRMEKLLDDVLEYSRADQEATSEAQELISGKSLIEDALATISPAKSFHIHVSDHFDRIRLPRMPLQRVLHNLIENALKHNDHESGIVDIDIEETSANYILSVQDDGPGIAPEYHNKIFEMFQTLKPRYNRDSTGMGLAMVKKLVTAHGGEVTVKSEAGGGAQFRVIWPKTLQQPEQLDVRNCA